LPRLSAVAFENVSLEKTSHPELPKPLRMEK